MTDEQLRKAARRNLKARNDFKVMLAIFVVVTAILVAVWFLTSGVNSYFWPIWPILGFIDRGRVRRPRCLRGHPSTHHRRGYRRRDRTDDASVGWGHAFRAIADAGGTSHT